MFKIEDYKGLNILNVLDTEAQKGIYQAYWDSVFCNYGNNVEWQKLRNHIYLCEETKNYIYSTPSATKYEQGKRPILDAVVWKVTKDLATDREKVLALLAFIRDLYLTHGKHFPFDFYGGTEEMLIEKGENLCECVSRLMVSLAEVIGIPGRIICHGVSGHFVCELYIEEKWCYFDPRFGIFYVDADEKFLSVLEIMENRDIIFEQPRWVKEYVSKQTTYEQRAERNFRLCLNPGEIQTYVNYSLSDHKLYSYNITLGGEPERNGCREAQARYSQCRQRVIDERFI